MEKKNIKRIAAASAVALAGLFMSAMPGDSILTKQGKTTVINTQDLSRKVRGYRGQTPVKIFIEKNKVVKVEPLRNQETPKYFAQAKTVLDKYTGKTVGKASQMEVDGVSGATLSSKALIKNVQLGLDYYKTHK